MGRTVYGNALHVLELICKSKSMPKNILKVNKNIKIGEKSVVHRSAASTPLESLLVVKMIRTHSRLAESECAFFLEDPQVNHSMCSKS